MEKHPYICGPLTELDPKIQTEIKTMYSRLADVCQETTGLRAFVPHEHFDPIAHPTYTPEDVYLREKNQICHETSLLIVVALEPTWGGGMEVGWCDDRDIPIVILKPAYKQISRLLLGSFSIRGVLEFKDNQSAISALCEFLKCPRNSQCTAQD